MSEPSDLVRSAEALARRAHADQRRKGGEDLPYFKSSTLFLVGGDAGISRDLSDTLSVGAEVGIRFQPKPGAENVFADPALAVVNDTGSRWSMPLSAFVTVRF